MNSLKIVRISMAYMGGNENCFNVLTVFCIINYSYAGEKNSNGLPLKFEKEYSLLALISPNKIGVDKGKISTIVSYL